MGDLHLKGTFPDLSSRMGGILEAEDSDRCEGSSGSQTLEEMERRMILQTLNQFGGNRTRTAESLGVSVRTIRNKLNHYGIMAKTVSAG